MKKLRNLSEEDVKKLLAIVRNGGSGKDIRDAGIRTSNGDLVSERQARRYRTAAVETIENTDDELLDRFVKGEGYMRDLNLDEEVHTAYPTIKAPRIQNKTAIMDIEVMSPAFGRMSKYSIYLLCVSFLDFETGEVKTLEITHEDGRDDKRLLNAVFQEMRKYTFIIGHNVKGYDLNWLMTRAIFYGWDIPDRAFYYCTYQGAKRIPLLHRKGLGNLIDFFRIKTAEKTQIMPIEWDRANSPHKADFDEAMQQIVYHCEQDVIANREVYDLVMKYDPKPSWKLWPR